MEQSQQQAPITWDQGSSQSGPAPDQSGITWDNGQAGAAPKSDEIQMSKTPITDVSSLADAASHAGAGVLEGVGEGVFGTLAGGADIANKIGSHIGLTDGKPGAVSKELHHLAGDDNAQHGTAQNIGQGIEAVGEFLMGDEALKGLSFADKLKHVSGVAKFLEKSPRLAKALELGINVGKAGTQLSPEERELLKAHPVIARLVSHGLSAVRQGIVQGVQTGVKTGGDVGEALKSGATMAGTSAAIGAPLGVAGGYLAKGAEAAKTAEELAGQAAAAPTEAGVNAQLDSTVNNALQPTIDTAQAAKDEAEGRLANAAQSPASMAANAPEHEAITGAAQKAAKNAYTALGDTFEKGRETLKAATEGQELNYEDSPLQQVSKDLMGAGKDEAHPLDEAFRQTRPGSTKANEMLDKLIDPYGEAELKDAAKEVGPDGEKTPSAQKAQEELDTIAEKKANEPITLNMEQLLDRRKLLNERLRGTGWATDEQRADRDIYHKLVQGVDDSIQQLTEQSGNPEAMQTLQKMNADYKAGITRFKNPDVKALLQGNVNDVAKRLMGGGTSVADINTVRDAIGKDAFTRLADSSVQRMAADAVDKQTGQFDFKTFFNKWNAIPSPVRQTMFQESLNGGAVENAIRQAQAVNASGVIPGAEATIKDTTKTIQDLLGNGNVKTLLNNPERVQQMAQTVGPEAMGELGNSVLQNQLREAATDATGNPGHVDIDKFMKFVSSLKDSPEVVDALFKPTPERAAAYDKLIADMQHLDATRSSITKLLKLGLLPLKLGSIAAGGLTGSHFGGLIPTVIGAISGLGLEAGAERSLTKNLIEKIANNPQAWVSMQKAAQSPIAQGATVVSKVAAGKTANAIRQAMNSASDSLQ